MQINEGIVGLNGILLLGGGGHCASVLDVLLESVQSDKIGIIDTHLVDGNILGVSVIGGDEQLASLFGKPYRHAAVTVGSTGNPFLRKKLFEAASSLGYNFPVISSESSIISRNSSLELGVFVGKSAVINAGSKVGHCSIVNSSALIEHHCVIGEFVHISPGAILCGNVQVGKDTHIGAGAVIKQGLRIGNGSIIGMGSVVLTDIPDRVVAVGNPCRIVRVNQ